MKKFTTLRILLSIFQITFFTRQVLSVGNYAFEQYTILKSQLSEGIPFQCPLTGAPNQTNTLVATNDIFWLNEKDQSDKDDADIIIATEILLLNGNLTYPIKREIYELSCGYLYQNKYVRIKKWQLSFVDEAMVELKLKVNDNRFTLNKYNNTFNRISFQPLNEFFKLNSSGNVLQLACENNFDLPLYTTIIWLTIIELNQSDALISNERWNRYYNNQTGLVQLFYNADTKESREFIYFLQNVLNRTSDSAKYRINIQCASYILINKMVARSHDFFLVSDNGDSRPINGEHDDDNLGLILGLVFGILGLILLIALMVCLLLYCRKKDRKAREKKKVTKTETGRQIQTIEATTNSAPAREIDSDEEITRRVYRSSFRFDDKGIPVARHIINENENASNIVTTAPNLYMKDYVIRKDFESSDSQLDANSDINFESKYYHEENNYANNYIYHEEHRGFYEIKALPYNQQHETRSLKINEI